MALTVGIPFATATNASLVTADMQSNRGINNAHFDENIRSLQVEKVNGIRTKSFLRGLEKSWKTPGEEFVLKSFLQRILEMPDTLENRGLAAKMQGTFFKQQGYLARVFSKETWEEWTENRTELGRVVFELKNCLESQTQVRNCVNKLDPNDLEKANEQAKIALTPKPLGMPESLGFQTNHGCLRGILGGTAVSAMTKQPWPLMLGLSQCLPQSFAQEKVGGEFQVNTYTTDEQLMPAVTTLNNGNIVAVWQSYGQDGAYTGIFGQILDSNGSKIGAEFQVNSITSGNQNRPKVAVLNNGNFIVVWDGSNPDISGQMFDETGTKIGNEINISTYPVSQLFSAVAALNNGGFVVSWTAKQARDGSGYGIYAQLFSPTATKIGGEFLVNTYTNNNQMLSAIEGLNNDNFVVTWTSTGQTGQNSDIFGQIFDETAAKVGTEFQVNSHTQLYQRAESISKLINGNFAIFWETSVGAQIYGVRGQLFQENGAKIGTEIIANAYTAKSGGTPSVAGLNNDHFVVTWASFQGTSGNESEVYGQLFESTGIKLGDEFQVNTYSTNSQRFSVTAALNNDRFVVLWASDGQTGQNSDIFGQVFRDNVTSSSSSGMSSSTTTSSVSGSTTVGTTQAGTGVVSSSSRLQGGLLGSALGLARKSFGDFIASHWPMG